MKSREICIEKILTTLIYLFDYPDMQNEVKEILFAYSEEIRLRIALLIVNSEVCVNCLVAVLKMPQSTISRHIGIMRRANIVRAERKGANVYYSANLDDTQTGKANRDLLEVYSSHFSNRPPFVTDRENLLQQKHVCTVECKVA